MKPRNTPLLFASSVSKTITEGDCACSSSSVNITLPDSFMRGRLMISAGLIQQKLDDDFQVFLSPKSDKGASLLNNAAIRRLNSFDLQIAQAVELAWEDLDSLARKFFTQGLVESLEENRAVDLNLRQPASLTSWLHLTDRCNLRCDYCYLPHVREDMSSETGRAAVDAIFRSAKINHFKQVKIKYAGGEPLLRYSLILELHTYAKSLADACGITLEEVVLSNGTLLTDEIASVFKSLDIYLMISLDGFGNYHDSHRPYASGRGSFKDVSEAVDLALAKGLEPIISVTVSSRTAEGLPEIMAWILKRDLPFSLNLYRENDFSSPHKDMNLDEEKIINGMLAAFQIIEQDLPKRSFLGSIVDRANLSFTHVRTCAVGQNYMVFDQNGQIAKCQMQMLRPVTDARVEDPLAILRADQIGIQNIFVDEKEGCNTCEWKHWCAGGCPLETHCVAGRYDVKSPNCNIYKALFPEVLRLEGLRLLKYAEDPEVVKQL